MFGGTDEGNDHWASEDGGSNTKDTKDHKENKREEGKKEIGRVKMERGIENGEAGDYFAERMKSSWKGQKSDWSGGRGLSLSIHRTSSSSPSGRRLVSKPYWTECHS